MSWKAKTITVSRKVARIPRKRQYVGAHREYSSPDADQAISPTTPSHGYKSQLNDTEMVSVKLGHRHPKFHAKPKGPTIPHIDLATLLCSYPYTTHKFMIFQPNQRKHFT